jgi:hypothetical protein
MVHEAEQVLAGRSLTARNECKASNCTTYSTRTTDIIKSVKYIRVLQIIFISTVFSHLQKFIYFLICPTTC